MLCLALISWGANAQNDHAAHGGHSDIQKSDPSFQDKSLGTAYSHYLHLKNALVESDFQKSRSASEALVKGLHQVRKADKAHAEAAKVAQSGNLDSQRKAFNALSNEMATLIKNSNLASGELYLEYCPMANGNTGGYWLSNEKEIRNPYFGDQMLKCGSIKEKIN